MKAILAGVLAIFMASASMAEEMKLPELKGWDEGTLNQGFEMVSKCIAVNIYGVKVLQAIAKSMADEPGDHSSRTILAMNYDAQLMARVAEGYYKAGVMISTALQNDHKKTVDDLAKTANSQVEDEMKILTPLFAEIDTYEDFKPVFETAGKSCSDATVAFGKSAEKYLNKDPKNPERDS